MAKEELPRTMRAWYLTGFGGVEKLEFRREAPVPRPGPGEVLIRVGACSVNNTDLWTREGAYADDEPGAWRGSDFVFPRIQGMDFAGTIAATGEGVDPGRMGERVLVNPTIEGPSGLYDATYIGSERDGGFAEYAAVPAENALVVRSSWSDVELASVMLVSLTAYRMLERAALAAGETILVRGAGGGVGAALCRLALLRGARAIAVAGATKAEGLRALGVSAIVDRRAADPVAAARELAGLGGADVVADVVAGDEVPAWLDFLKEGGRYVTAGAAAGAMVRLDWRRLYLRHLTLLGSTMGNAEDARSVVRLIEEGGLRSLAAASYPLEDLVRAQLDFKAGNYFGKLVIAVR